MSSRGRSWSSWVVLLACTVAPAAWGQAPSSPSVPALAPTSSPAPVAKPAPPQEVRELRIVVAGRAPVVVTPTALQAHPALASTAAGGKARQVPLRALLDKLVGPGARVVVVTDATGGKAVVAPAAWAAPGVVPVLWTNRRGLFKVGFVDGQGRRLNDSAEYRDVVELAVVFDR